MSHGTHRRLLSRKALRDIAERYRTQVGRLSSDLVDLTVRNAALQREIEELRNRARMPSRGSIDATQEPGREE